MFSFSITENGCTHQDFLKLGAAEHGPNYPDRWRASQVHRHHSGSHNPDQNCEYQVDDSSRLHYATDFAPHAASYFFFPSSTPYRRSRLYDGYTLSAIGWSHAITTVFTFAQSRERSRAGTCTL